MQTADFVNDLCKNYMTVLYEGPEDSFSLRMLAENETDEFLPLKVRRLNGEKFLYYDISGKQSLEVMYAEKPIDKEAFQAFMWNLHETLEQGRELFLPESGICLETSMLFWDLEKQRWQYAYLPDRDGEDAETIQSEKERLAEFLVMRMDYEDRSLTEAVYRFYEEMCAGRMRPESFLGREKAADGGERIGISGKSEKETEGGWETGREGKEAEDRWETGGEEKKNENGWGIGRKNAVDRWEIGERESETEDEWEQRGKDEKIKSRGKERKKGKKEEGKRKGRTKRILLILLLAAVALTFLLSRYDGTIIVPGGMICLALAGLLLRVLIKQQKACADDLEMGMQETPESQKTYEDYRAYAVSEASEVSGESVAAEGNFWMGREKVFSEDFRQDRERYSKTSIKDTLEKPSDETYDETYDGRTVYVDIQKEQEGKLYGVGRFRKQKIPLQKLPFVIGKDKSMSDFAISDSSISRMHVRFFAEGEQLWMQDLNSTNGTYHNGLRLKPNEKALLEPEDEIGIGRVQFVYR